MIAEVKRTSPVTYRIADLDGGEITGTFYEPELQKTNKELFRIDKVIKKRGKKKSLVKWKGYSGDFNSWVDNKDIVNIYSLKMILIKNVMLPNKPLSNFE